MDDFLWWRDGVIYQIYPRSFADSDGDGVGDLKGIISRLDHLRGTDKSLGVDAIWLSPVYPSPNLDFGYDVKDHEAIDPRFGTLADFDQLVAEAHRRGLRVIMDMVFNHTSDQHPWFVESRSSQSSPRRDWYVWANPGPRNAPPNHWKSVFGGSAWEWDETSSQYYYHRFLKEQPDLNWHNPEVRERIFQTVRFWLERGVDGLRLDVFNVYVKDNLLRDNPPKLGIRPYDWQRHVYDQDRPELTEILKRLRTLLDSWPERMAVGEVLGSDPDIAARYLGDGHDQLHLVFNFQFSEQPWSPSALQQAIRTWDTLVPRDAQPCYVLSNHDIKRHASRFGSAEHSNARARIAAAMLLTLRGTPFLYAGEEIGMREGNIPFIAIQDPLGRRYWPAYKGRDGCRTPIPWGPGAHGDFTTGTPWLPLAEDPADRNVQEQREDPQSILNFYRRLIAFRRTSPALLQGRWLAMKAHPHRVLAYIREAPDQTLLIALNFTKRRVSTHLCSALPPYRWNLVLSSSSSTHVRLRGTETLLTLEPYEACILERVR